MHKGAFLVRQETSRLSQLLLTDTVPRRLKALVKVTSNAQRRAAFLRCDFNSHLCGKKAFIKAHTDHTDVWRRSVRICVCRGCMFPSAVRTEDGGSVSWPALKIAFLSNTNLLFLKPDTHKCLADCDLYPWEKITTYIFIMSLFFRSNNGLDLSAWQHWQPKFIKNFQCSLFEFFQDQICASLTLVSLL